VITHNSRPLAEAAGAQLNLDKLSVAPRADNTKPTTCLAAALSYAEMGVSVFPLSARKKPLALCVACKPRVACPGRDNCRCGVNTCHGFYAATTDPAVIQDWWGKHPHWQLGIRTGSSSDLVALDVDVDKGGLDSLIALQAAGCDITGAAVQLSGSGRSFHLLFAHPGVPVRNSQGQLGAGLDVRGDGGYVVGAPSLHASTGAAYELLGHLRCLPGWPLPAAPAPTVKVPGAGALPGASALREFGPMTPARLAALVAQVRDACEGQRRSSLFWAACRLGEASGRQAVLLAAATLLLQAAEETDLDRAEAYATLRDGVLHGRTS
jgi:hypothetical protein